MDAERELMFGELVRAVRTLRAKAPLEPLVWWSENPEAPCPPALTAQFEQHRAAEETITRILADPRVAG